MVGIAADGKARTAQFLVEGQQKRFGDHRRIGFAQGTEIHFQSDVTGDHTGKYLLDQGEEGAFIHQLVVIPFIHAQMCQYIDLAGAYQIQVLLIIFLSLGEVEWSRQGNRNIGMVRKKMHGTQHDVKVIEIKQAIGVVAHQLVVPDFDAPEDADLGKFLLQLPDTGFVLGDGGDAPFRHFPRQEVKMFGEGNLLISQLNRL